MGLREIYSSSKTGLDGRFDINSPIISFEIYPPKNDEDSSKLDKLINHLSVLKKYNPAFISLTYGAGGTTQSSSFEIIKRVQEDVRVEIMPHFTCVNTSREHVKQYLDEIASRGIDSILALRGDIPDGMTHENFDFHYANELVDFIRGETDLSIGVAGYPEGHIDCETLDEDIYNLKRKIDSGADVIFTQMFFDNKKLFRFLDLIAQAGIHVPVIPGILPIRSYAQLERMLSMAKVTLPSSLMDKLEKYKDSPDDIKKIGIDFATIQCGELIEQKIKGLHFYTLNTSRAVSQILDSLSLNV